MTGGAGFIGSHLVDRLASKRRRVLVLDNLLTGRRSNVRAALGTGRVKMRRVDVAGKWSVAGRVDRVWHLASPASPVDYTRHPVETLLVGSQGTRAALDLARKKDADFLLASTSEVYGDPEVSPQPESYWGRVNPIGPRSCYDEAKRFGEALTMAYRRAYGLETRIARIFNTYGPRMRADDGRVVPNFINQALRGEALTVYGDGQQTRSFCFVADLVDGLLALMERGDQEPTNLGSPHEMTVLEFARRIRRFAGRDLGIVHRPAAIDDPRQRRPDIRKARRLLGWSPKVPVTQGLRETWEYFAAAAPVNP